MSKKDEADVAISGASSAPTILFVRSDATPADGAPHLDPFPTDRSQRKGLERLVSLGAKPTDVMPLKSWHDLANPEGNRFSREPAK
ncbi:MAG: VOC family protein [Brevibacterium sp.]